MRTIPAQVDGFDLMQTFLPIHPLFDLMQIISVY